MARGTFKIKGYTAYGRITGSCGHLHKSERAAEKCARLDKDKHVCAVDEDGYLWSDYGYYKYEPVYESGGRQAHIYRY